MDSTVQLRIDGMTCLGCAGSVTKKLTGVAGVSSATVDLAAGKATVHRDESRATVDDLIAAVEQLGFHAARS